MCDVKPGTVDKQMYEYDFTENVHVNCPKCNFCTSISVQFDVYLYNPVFTTELPQGALQTETQTSKLIVKYNCPKCRNTSSDGFAQTKRLYTKYMRLIISVECER